MRKTLLCLFAVLASAVLLFANAVVEEPDPVRLDIYSTNAFHGRLEADDGAGAALLAAYIEHFREENPDMVMLDAGNALQGTAVSTFFDGKPVVEFFNMAGYDALNCGNHEYDWKPSALKEIVKDAQAPFLGANVITRNGKPVDFTVPYTIVERAGVGVGILGLIDPGHFDAIAASSLEGLAFIDAAAVANYYIPIMRRQGADVIVLLAMVPGHTDENGVAQGNLVELAKDVEGADAIVGSLHDEVAAVIDGKPVVLAWRYGEKLGHISLVYDRTSGKVVDGSAEVIQVKGNPLGLEPDKEVAEMVASYAEKLKEANSKPIGKVSKTLPRGGGETAIGNWIVDSMKESAHAQIAFTNPGGIRAELPAGEITGDAIFKICPFPNTICVATMKGGTLLRFLEQCASVAPIPISGVRFSFDKNLPEGQRVVEAALSDGTPIEEGADYRVATNSFLKDGKDGYTVLAEVDGWEDTGVLMRDAMTAYVLSHGEVNAETEGRITDLTK